jgi:predicted dehydrogenase
MNKKLKTAVVGLWGHDIYALEMMRHPMTEFTGACDWSKKTERTESLKSYCKEYKGKFFSSIDKLLEQGPFDAIGLLSPPSETPGLVEKIAPYTKGIFLEKPVAKDLEGARKILKQAEKYKLNISIAYPTRCSSQVESCKKIIDDGKIGKPLTGVYTYLQTGGPMFTVNTDKKNLSQISGGDDTMFLGYGVLDLELLSGGRINKVFARGGAFFYEKYRKAGINDLCHINIKMDNGFVGSLTVGRITAKGRPALHSIDISGKTGSLSADFSKDRLTSFTETGKISGVPQNSAEELVNDFITALAGKKKACYTAFDAFHTIAVQEAVKKSIESGKEEKVAEK